MVARMVIGEAPKRTGRRRVEVWHPDRIARRPLRRLLARLSIGKIVACTFCFALLTVYLQHAALRAHVVASAERSLSMLRRARSAHPASCAAPDLSELPVMPEPPNASSVDPELERLAIAWVLRRQRIFTALEGSSSQLDELVWTAQALPTAQQQREPIPDVAPLTAIGLHDEPSTVCRQARALLSQRPPPAQLWLVTFAPPTRVRPSDRAARVAERTAAAAHVEARRSPATVYAVRLPSALRAHAHLQLALQVTTEYVIILEPRALPSQWFIQTALALAAHARATGELPALLGEAGCVVLPANELHALGSGPPRAAAGAGAAVGARGGAHAFGNTGGQFGHLCAPDAASGLLIERPVHVDYLDGFAFMHASWAKLFFAAEPAEPAGDAGDVKGEGGVRGSGQAQRAASVFLTLSDTLRRALGARTLLLPASLDAPGAALPTPRGGLKWPAHVLGEPAPDRTVVRALRAGMQPVVLERDGRMRSGSSGAGSKSSGSGSAAAAQGGVAAGAIVPTERWLLVAYDYVAARALAIALGPLCASPDGGSGSVGGAAADEGMPPRTSVRCDVLVADESGGAESYFARGAVAGGAATTGAPAFRDVAGAGDLRWGRAFSSEDGWSTEVERRDESTRARRLTRVLVHLRETVRPHLVIAAVGEGTIGGAANGGTTPGPPDALEVALRVAFGGGMRDSALSSPAFASIAAWDAAGAGPLHGDPPGLSMGGGGGAAGNGGAALADAGEGGGSSGAGADVGARGAGGEKAGRATVADAELADIAPARSRARLPVMLPAAQLPSASWIATLPPRALAQWHVPRVTIVVITWRRPQSLKRLCAALAVADYFGDTVELKFTMDAGADVETRRFVASFKWPHGPKSATVRAEHAGLAVAVVESWQPSADDEYAVLLEDDIEVAPSFYGWLKYALLMYRHGDEEAKDPRLIGISLYTPRLVEVARPRRRIDLFVELGGRPFLQQLPCSWGALFFPEPWRAFRDYLLHRMAQDPAVQVKIPGSVVDGWKGSWKKYLIELMYRRAQWMLYPNFKNQSSFSTNHLEAGEHIGAKANSLDHAPADFTVPLLGRDFVHQLPGRSLERLASRVVRLDLFSNRTSDDDAVYKGLDLLAKQTAASEAS